MSPRRESGGSAEVMRPVQPARKDTQTPAHAADNKLPRSSTCHSGGGGGGLALIPPPLIYFGSVG